MRQKPCYSNIVKSVSIILPSKSLRGNPGAFVFGIKNKNRKAAESGTGEPMNIVYALTRNLYSYLKPTLTSLLEHNQPEKIYILAEDDELPGLPDNAEVINVSKQKWFPPDNPNMKSQFTYMAMCRACYCELLPVDKVIQLDIDTIICDSLEPIWNIDLTDKWFAACPEYLGLYNPFGKQYYNIGVCVYNLEQMRKDNAQDQLVNILNLNKLFCLEQDAINYLGVPKKVKDIPVRYNESFCCGYTDDPAVVHFAGWPDCWTNKTLFRHEYLERYMG